MIARLTVHLPRQPTKTLVAESSDAYEIGRDPDCGLRLEDARVSRRHARLWHDGSTWLVEDLASKNGLTVDGEPVERARLETASWLGFGGLMSRFEPLSDDSPWSRERARRWQTSLDAHRSLAGGEPKGEELLDRLLTSVLEITRAERGFVLLSEASGDRRIAARKPETAGDSFSGSSSAVERVLADGRPLAESDVVDDSVLAGQPSVMAGGIRALVCLPLEAADERLGVIYADSTQPGAAFDELDLQILEALTSHAALALWIASIDKELHGLTGDLPTAFGAEMPAQPDGGDLPEAKE